MARVVLLCRRDRNAELADELRGVAALARRLTPDGIEPAAPYVFCSDGRLLMVVNPAPTSFVRDGSVAVGWLVKPDEDWWRPGAAVPEGGFGLFRSDPDAVELVADALGTRTLWYALTDELFVAATCQRSVVAGLRSFEPDPTVCPWVLSTGRLPVGRSWDRRIRPVPSGGRVYLDRHTWRLSHRREPAPCDPIRPSYAEAERHYCEVVDSLFADLGLRPEEWAVSLSGGVDSRAVVAHLPEAGDCHAFTYAAADRPAPPDSDVVIAAQVAARFGMDHAVLPLRSDRLPAEEVLRQFVTAGEGRTDELAGYVDGFAVWRSVRERGVARVLRGDLALYSHAVATELDLRRELGLLRLDEYRGMPAAEALGLAEQTEPEITRRLPGESLADQRERLWGEVSVPTQFAALTALKAGHVEVFSPLQCRRIAAVARSLPPVLRTGKPLMRRVAAARCPGIPVARRGNLPSTAAVLRTPPMRRALHEGLSSPGAPDALPEPVRALALAAVARDDATSAERAARWRSWIRRAVPDRVWTRLKALKPAPVLDPILFAFRAWMIVEVHLLLAADATTMAGGTAA